MTLESKELMAVCLRKISGLSKVKLIDAGIYIFICSVVSILLMNVWNVSLDLDRTSLHATENKNNNPEGGHEWGNLATGQFI